MLKRILNRNGTTNYSDEEQRGVQGNVASVHQLVPLQSMFGNMLVLKDGSYRMIMKVGAVNFDLRGPHEQMMILNTFGEMLNTLQIDFPLQIMLHSAYLDTESYVREYRERLMDPALSPAMRVVIEDHIQYFTEQARDNHLLDRSYFVVVSYYDQGIIPQGDGGVAQDMPLGGMLGRILDSSEKEKTNTTKRRDMEKARIQLQNRCGLVASQLSRLGIQSQLLDELAVLRLLRSLYNPGVSQHSGLENTDSTGSFITTQVRPGRLNRAEGDQGGF